MWIPSAMFGVGYRFCDAFERSCRVVDMIGRLRQGVTLKDAQAEIDVVGRQLEQSYPATNLGTGATLVPARGLGLGPLAGETRQVALFLAVVALVLVIACANIAGLLLARATGRRKEIAIRLALGSGRARLIRQLLTESLLLAVLGGFAGLLFAFWGNAALDALYSRDSAGYPVDFHLSLSGLVIASTTAVTTLAALLFGVLPAVHASRADVMVVLKDEGASGGARRTRVRQVLVAGQLALSVMLLIGAGLVIQSVRHLYAGPGFDPSHVSMLRLRPSLVGYSFPRANAYQRQVVQRLESLPGIVSASPSSFLATMGAGVRVTVTTRPGDAASTNPIDVVGGHVGPRYFSTLGLPLIEGREFSDQDSRATPKVTVINDVLARKLWPAGRAEGRTLLLHGTPHTVVGVVPDAQYYAAGEPPRGQVFYDYWQVGDDDAFLKDARMLVRVAGDPRAMTAVLRRETAAVDPAVPIVEDYPLSDRVAYAYQPVRVARTVLASFAVLALVLSAVGLYGVLAVMVAQRTREIGLRMALGARRGQVGALVVRDALQMTVCGVGLGIAAAWLGGRLLGSLLYGVGGSDAATFVLAPVVLVAVAALASFIPVRRATGVSPTIALRYE
jgi:predicted permease